MVGFFEKFWKQATEPRGGWNCLPYPTLQACRIGGQRSLWGPLILLSRRAIQILCYKLAELADDDDGTVIDPSFSESDSNLFFSVPRAKERTRCPPFVVLTVSRALESSVQASATLIYS